MKIRVKKLHADAVIPQYAKQGDAGLDLTAVTMNLADKGYLEFGTGLAIEIPAGYVGLVFPRSSISNYNMSLTNSVGVVDSGYRGEIRFRFKPTLAGTKSYKIGDRVGQLVIIPYPQIELEEAEELDDTIRGVEGFGSSDLMKPKDVIINEAGLVERSE